MTTLHRFFVPPDEATGDRFVLPATVEHQVRRVLRMGDGDRLILLTGDGVERVGRLDGEDVVIEEERLAVGEPAHRLTIVQALLKGDGLEEVVQQGTELGVTQFELVVTERCVARGVTERKLERLRAIARESAEQSERGVVPRVLAPVPLKARLRPGTVVLAERSGRRLRDAEPPSEVVIGPEGGFTQAELSLAEDAGALALGLGPRILRARTVAAAVTAAVLSRTGDFA